MNKEAPRWISYVYKEGAEESVLDTLRTIFKEDIMEQTKARDVCEVINKFNMASRTEMKKEETYIRRSVINNNPIAKALKDLNISSLESLKERFKLYEGLAEKEYEIRSPKGKKYLVVPIEDFVRIVFGEVKCYRGMEEQVSLTSTFSLSVLSCSCTVI